MGSGRLCTVCWMDHSTSGYYARESGRVHLSLLKVWIRAEEHVTVNRHFRRSGETDGTMDKVGKVSLAGKFMRGEHTWEDGGYSRSCGLRHETKQTRIM